MPSVSSALISFGGFGEFHSYCNIRLLSSKCWHLYVIVKTSKPGALLSNLNERLLQTDQGTYVLCSTVSPSQNTGKSCQITALQCMLFAF